VLWAQFTGFELDCVFSPTESEAVHHGSRCSLTGLLLHIDNFRSDEVPRSTCEETLAALSQSRTIRVFVIAFETFEHMSSVCESNTLQDPPLNQIAYRFVCQRTREHRFEEIEGGNCVGIDPRSMEPTGETWGNSGGWYNPVNIVPALLESQ